MASHFEKFIWWLLATAFLMVLQMTVSIRAAQDSTPVARQGLSAAAASSFARVALRCVEKEFPNKLDHVMNDPGEVRGPRDLHPAFYGCFDWHSAVHGHWMLVRLLTLFPDLPEAVRIRQVLDQNLRAENIGLEVQYLEQPNRKSFERTYGWAWLLKLAAELRKADDPDMRRWAANLEPLAQAIANRYREFLPRQRYPIRTGVHPNTAFGIALALDYAQATGLKNLETSLKERARAYFGEDRDYPAEWEPGGEDFLSPALMEAELMRRVMPAQEFHRWFSRFLPGLTRANYPALLKPAVVTDRTDPKLVHLDGLNLSRAWCMKGIARGLPSRGRERKALMQAADIHLRATLPHIASGNYEGEHWLATFSVLALSE